MVRVLLIVFTSLILFNSCFTQTKEYKPVKKVYTAIIGNKIKKTTVTYIPTVKYKDVAVINDIYKDGVKTKSFITYKKKKVIYWRSKTKNSYSTLVK